MNSYLRAMHGSIPGNIKGRNALERVEKLAEDYDRLRTERLEIERILDRAGIKGGSLPGRVEQLRLRLALARGGLT